MKTLIPTQLFIGPSVLLAGHVELLLQNFFCEQGYQGSELAQCFCIQCRKIKSGQHHAIVQICPEAGYKIDDIDIIFEKIQFALDEDKKFFFVLEKVERLSLAVANKLLKALEEPPAGYNFLLMTTNENAVLKTIVSRCHLVRLAGHESATPDHPMLDYFISAHKLQDPFGFMQMQRQNKLTDSESRQLVDSLLLYFSRKVLQAGDTDESRDFYCKVVRVIKKHMRKPPQSGSSNLFWKNLFLHFPRH